MGNVWRTFHHDGKISPRPPPFTLVTITSYTKLQYTVNTLPERTDHPPCFISTPFRYSVIDTKMNPLRPEINAKWNPKAHAFFVFLAILCAFRFKVAKNANMNTSKNWPNFNMDILKHHII
jgi:hypothetical protein